MKIFFEMQIVKPSATLSRNRLHTAFCSQDIFLDASSIDQPSVECINISKIAPLWENILVSATIPWRMRW